MAKKSNTIKPIEQYQHSDKERVNNPHIGMVNDKTEKYEKVEKKTYEYDPHLDPQLVWAGKAERTSFEVPTVSLHVHERIDPKTIIETVKKAEKEGVQISLFEQEKKPLREAIEFYKHKEGWTNRLIAGDSLLVMNSLLEKEAMGGKIQMVYFDPPYGISYGSNFQPFVNKKEVKEGKDEDLTQEPEMLKAFRDTWQLGIHSYLSYMKDRLFLAKDLLIDSGSLFIQISDENLHLIRNLLDEIFGASNYLTTITYRTRSPLGTKGLAKACDYLIWYAKDKNKVKLRDLFQKKKPKDDTYFNKVELEDGSIRNITEDEINGTDSLPKGAMIFSAQGLLSSGRTESCVFPFVYENKSYFPGGNRSWRTNEDGMNVLAKKGRLIGLQTSLRFKQYLQDFPYKGISNIWTDTFAETGKVYVVQTNTDVIEKCILMTSDPGDIILDPTCGSGTTAYVAENWGRRWITCDSSRIAITLAKQRLLTSYFQYFKLARHDEGISGGFEYKSVDRITLKTIAQNEPPSKVFLYNQPLIEKNKLRITGPFTVESIPAPFVKNLDEAIGEQMEADNSVAKSGETLRQDQWRDELLRTGIRAKEGVIMEFSRIEAQQGTKYIQALAETKEDNPKNVLVVFGPEHSPMDARLVELALDEAKYLKPDILLFCAFQFDEEAAKDIDETPENLIGFKLLKAQMNMDLQTEDLKKNRNTNQSFWLIGQPDVRVHESEDGNISIEVVGFDYYNPKTGEVNSGGQKNIAMWMLDPDYDGRSIFPKQVFFPMAGATEGWSKLAKTLKAEIDEEKIEAYRGTTSLPFKPGKQVAVKIIDDRGIESLKVIKR